MAYKNEDTAGDWNTIMEPQSEANTTTKPEYPLNYVMSTESGHYFEMDDTPERERIRLQHRSNTFIEMHSDGTEVHKIWGDGYEIVLQNKKVLVKGACTIAVDGNAAIEVKGNAFSKVKGNFSSIIEGSGTINAKKGLNLNSSEGAITLTGSTINLNADTVSTFGDLQCKGDLGLAESIIVNGNITATGVVIGMVGVATPGSLIVGPGATYPLAGFLPPRVEVTTTLVSITSATTIGAIATGAISLNAGVDFTASAVGTAQLIGIANAVVTSMGVTFVEGTQTTVFGKTNATLLSPVSALVSGGATAMIASPTVEITAGITNATGIFNVTGMCTALDFISLINPTPYSIHGHAPLALTPPVPI